MLKFYNLNSLADTISDVVDIAFMDAERPSCYNCGSNEELYTRRSSGDVYCVDCLTAQFAEHVNDALSDFIKEQFESFIGE